MEVATPAVKRKPLYQWVLAKLSEVAPVILRSPYLILAVAGLVCYWGVWQEGLQMDDFTNFEVFHNTPIFNLFSNAPYKIVLDPQYNRFPLWAFGFYYVYLYLPLWLSHSMVAAVHIANGILFAKLLEKMDFGRNSALIAGLLFIIWPSHVETVHWLVAAAQPHGALLALVGLHFSFNGKQKLALLFIFLGCLCSESILFFGGFGLVVMLLYRRRNWQTLIFLPGALAVLYGLFTLAKILLNSGGKATQYAIGTNKLWDNFVSLAQMQLGQATTVDVAYLWNPELTAKYTGLFLDLNFFILASFVGAVLTLVVLARQPLATAETTPGKWAFPFWLIGLVAGWLCAMAVFLLISEQNMQTRYTYTMSFFFCTLVVLLLSRLDWLTKKLLPRFSGTFPVWLCGGAVCLVGWGLFAGWSNTYLNWIPARQVTDQIVWDVKQAYQEKPVSTMFVVNEPRVVGNAYALGNFWAYSSVGRLLVDKNLTVTDELWIKLWNDELKVGSRFSEKSCLFITWKAGQRIVSPVASAPFRKLYFDCNTGLITKLDPSANPAIVIDRLQASQLYLRELIPTLRNK